MDAKITLSFDKEVINKAKKFAEDQNISLSRLTEYLFTRITSGEYKTLDELPVADWVNVLAEGQAEYQKPRSRESMKKKFYGTKG